MTGFIKNLFWKNKHYLGGLIDPKEFDENVEKATKEIALVYSYNRKKNVEGISLVTYTLLVAQLALFFSYVALVYFGLKWDREDLRIAAFFCLGISFFSGVVVGLRNMISTTIKYTPFRDMIRKTLEASFDKLNKRYRQRGIRYIVHNDLHYLGIEVRAEKAENYRRLKKFHISQLDEAEEKFNHKMAKLKTSLMAANKTIPHTMHVSTEGGPLFTQNRDDDGVNLIADKKEDDFENKGMADLITKMRK